MRSLYKLQAPERAVLCGLTYCMFQQTASVAVAFHESRRATATHLP